jgi:hypothetical protein
MCGKKASTMGLFRCGGVLRMHPSFEDAPKDGCDPSAALGMTETAFAVVILRIFDTGH